MRLHALLALLLSCISSVHTILADEAYQVDYHQALLGVPQVESTFFHRPSPSSSASLLYAISDKAVLGAVNPKDGSLLWRQPLAGPLPTSHLMVEDVVKLSGREQLNTFRDASLAKAALLAEDGIGILVSYYGSLVSAWDATNGKLIWQRMMPQGRHVKSAVLMQSRQNATSFSKIDVIVLSDTDSGTVVKLDGSSGVIKWEHIDSR